MLRRPYVKIAGISSLLFTCAALTLPAHASVTAVGFEWVSPYDASNSGAMPNAPMPQTQMPQASAPSYQGGMQNPEIISPVIIDGTRPQQSSQPSQPPPQYASYANQTSPYANPPVIISNASPAPGPVAPSGTAPVVVSSSTTPMSGTYTNSNAAASGATGDMGGQINAPVVGGLPSVAPPSSANSGANSGIDMSSINPRPSVEMPAQSSTTGSDVVQGFANQVPLAVALRQLLPPGYGFSIDQNVDLGTLVSFRGGRPWRDTLRDTLAPAGLIMREQGQMVTIAKAGGPVMATATPSFMPPVAPMAPPAPTPLQTNTNDQHYLQPPVNVEPVVLPPNVPQAASVPGVQTWTAERGDTLHQVLQDWSRRANVEFEWMSEYDYPLAASASFTGTFEESVRNLLTGFENAHPQPIAELHTNPTLGQMVLIIQTRGNNYSD